MPFIFYSEGVATFIFAISVISVLKVMLILVHLKYVLLLLI